MSFSPRTVPLIGIDLLLLAVCLVQLPGVMDRPRAPFDVSRHDQFVMVETILHQSACPDLREGDILQSWNGTPTRFPEMIEYLADAGTIGSRQGVSIGRADTTFGTSVTLIPYYPSIRFMLVHLFIGVTMFVLGLFILTAGSNDPAGPPLHWCIIGLGTTIMMTWGATAAGSWETITSRIIWFLAYTGTAVSFYFFTLRFPRISSSRFARLPGIMILLVLGIGGLLSYLNLKAIHSSSDDDWRVFQRAFDVFHLSLFVLTGGGLYNLGASLRGATSHQERAKLYWVFWGLAAGATPFLLFHILPQVLLARYIVPEEYTTLFFLAIPFAFAISYLRFRLFDVEVLINRSIVYSILSLFLASIVVLVALLATSAMGEATVFGDYLLFAIVSIVAGVAVNPMRKRLQRIVEETLFPARAHFQATLASVGTELRSALSPDELFAVVCRSLEGFVPAEALGVYEVQQNRLVRRQHSGLLLNDHIDLQPQVEEALLRARVMMRNQPIDAAISKTGIREWLEQNRFSIGIPLTTDKGKLLGMIAARHRPSIQRFDDDEVNLLIAVAELTTEILERFDTQEQLYKAREEHRRLEEVNSLKSYFISSVSHELRMPLTSIRMFAETLRSSKRLSPRKKREYLGIIEGESERLSRLIGNVLDFAKIEKGLKEYNFKTIDLTRCIRTAAQAMAYQVAQHKGSLSVRIPRTLPPLEADPDALEEALLNLLSNALKYSGTRKEIVLKAFSSPSAVTIMIADKGFGIPKEELPNIFDKFYRVRDERTRQVGGTGLGLALVKHIVEAHRGTIGVTSTVGRGTTFTITLPRKKTRRKRS